MNLFVLFFLVSGLFFGCSGSAPVAPADPLAPDDEDRAIQQRLAGHTAHAVFRSSLVSWVLGEDTYRFQIETRAGGLQWWEEGAWWVRQSPVRGRLFFAERRRGAQRMGEGFQALNPLLSAFPLELLGRGLQDEALHVRLQMGGSVLVLRLSRAPEWEQARVDFFGEE